MQTYEWLSNAVHSLKSEQPFETLGILGTTKGDRDLSPL